MKRTLAVHCTHAVGLYAWTCKYSALEDQAEYRRIPLSSGELFALCTTHATKMMLMENWHYILFPLPNTDSIVRIIEHYHRNIIRTCWVHERNPCDRCDHEAYWRTKRPVSSSPRRSSFFRCMALICRRSSWLGEVIRKDNRRIASITGSPIDDITRIFGSKARWQRRRWQ